MIYMLESNHNISAISGVDLWSVDDMYDSCFECGGHHLDNETKILFRVDDFATPPEEILAALEDPSSNSKSPGAVTQVLGNLIVKHHQDTRLLEAQTSEFVRQTTQIPIPRVFLVFCAPRRLGRSVHIVSEFIEGQTLKDVWGDLTAAQKDVAFDTIASYIQQLQAIPNPPEIPGPLDRTCSWRGRFFVEDMRPLQSYQELLDYFNHKRDVTARFGHKDKFDGVPDAFTSDYPLVFTHGDIAPRNVIYDKEGRMWLIDWDCAGWYPVYLEYATISVENEWQDSSITKALKPYDKELNMLMYLSWAVYSAPFA